MENSIRSGMWNAEFDENGDVKKIVWSQDIRRMFGFQNEEDFPNKLEAWFWRVHPDDQKAVLGAHRAATRLTGKFEAEYRILTKDNTYMWIRDRGEVLRDKDNNPVCYTGVMTAIDRAQEEKWSSKEKRVFLKALEQAQSDLEKQNDILRALCSDYVSIYRVDLERDEFEIMLMRDELRGRITRLVQSEKKYSEALEEYIAAYIHEDDAHYVREMTKRERIMEKMAEQEKYFIRYRVKDNDEDVEYFEVHFVRIQRTTSPIVIVGFRNVDQLFREREAERLANQRDIEETLEGAKTGLWYMECEPEQATRLFADRTMRRLLGIEERVTPEKCYKLWEEGVAEGYLEQALEAVEEMARDGRAEVVYPWNHPTLGVVYFRCGGVKDSDYGNGGFRIKGYHQDITETMAVRQKQEKALLQALEEANKANSAKTEFLSHMSHDIRTPINGILGTLLISEKNPDDPVRQKDCREKIRASAEHLLSLVNDVLDITKLESGVVNLTKESFSVREVMNSCSSIMKIQASERKLDFHIDCRKVNHEFIIGSPLHLRQILVNIIGNAVKYNRRGGEVLVTVEEKALTSDVSDYLFIVRDTGIGMTEEFQQHIFEPFTQEVNYARTYYQGTGLGMSITKKLVEQMGGNILLESTEGVGSCFTVILPFKIDLNVQEGNLREKKASADISGMHVLLVEDNELNSEIVEYLLDEAGATVEKASNGKEAVELFAASRPGQFDCILMDVLMPVMDGIEATKLIRRQERSDAAAVPIIALTANAFSEDVYKVKQAGMNGHVAKPIDVDRLFEMMSSCAGRGK